MIITYGGVILAPGGLAGEPGAFRLNQRTITDPATFFRAAAMAWFNRGNASVDLGFQVTRQFNSLKDAWVFLTLHANSLAGQDDLVLTCGEGVDVHEITLPDAVLASVSPVPIGVSVTVGYSFQGGQFTS
jgi:hypothetical protein